jgi:hypothetical protein
MFDIFEERKHIFENEAALLSFISRLCNHTVERMLKKFA